MPNVTAMPKFANAATPGCRSRAKIHPVSRELPTIADFSAMPRAPNVPFGPRSSGLLYGLPIDVATSATDPATTAATENR